MSGAIVLVVLIAGRDDPASTDAALKAARTALPAETSIVLQRLDAPPSDDAVLEVEKRERAQAVAVVVTDATGRRVRLHVHRADDRRWIDRDIAFESVDQAGERGRTLGFAMASMMPESFSSPSPPPPPPVTAPPPAAPEKPERPLPLPLRAPVAALDAAALGALGISGYAGGLGARVGAAWLPSPRVGLRLDGTIRSAEVAPAQVSSLVVTAGPGVSIDAVAADPVGLGFRLSALAIYHAHSHLRGRTGAPIALATGCERGGGGVTRALVGGGAPPLWRQRNRLWIHGHRGAGPQHRRHPAGSAFLRSWDSRPVLIPNPPRSAWPGGDRGTLKLPR